MPDNRYIWNSDFGRKPKKDPYDNPMGFTGKPSGITSDAEAINRQSRETDNAIGAEALRQRKADPVRIPEAEPVRPAPAPAIEPQPEKTDKPDINGTNGTNGNRFGYADKAYVTGGDETAKRDREYKDNLRMDSGNEGFTTGDSESYRQLEAESQKRIENLTAFLGTFLEGNEKEERFANGLPAPGEANQSVFITYRDATNRSDNVGQEDWGKGIKDLNKTSFGQAVMDIYHSAAAGGYDLAKKAAILSHMLDFTQHKSDNRAYIQNGWTDPDTRIRYSVNPSKLNDYRTWKQLKDAEQSHKDARSDDFKQDWKTNPGYLPIKAAGNGLEDILTPVVTAWLALQTGQFGQTAVPLVSGAVGGFSKGYQQKMEEKENIPEADMMKDPVYAKMRRHGWNDEQARFALSVREAEAEGWVQGLYGLVSSNLTGKAVGVTRDGTEGELLKGSQDHFGGYVGESILDFVNGRKK